MKIIIGILLLAFSFQSAAELPGCDKCVDKQDIAPKAVTSGKIAPDAVTRSKLAPESVGSAQLVDGAITRQKLAGSLAGGLALGLDLVDSSGQRFPLILLGESVNVGYWGYQQYFWEGFVNIEDDLLLRLQFNRNAINARRAARLYYSGANCSEEVYFDANLSYGVGLQPYPITSPKTLVTGGTIAEAPLEVFIVGQTHKDEMQVQSFRDIGSYAPVLGPRVGPYTPDPYGRPETDGYPPIIRDVCINELNSVKNLRELQFVTELQFEPPLSIRVR